MTSTSLRRLLWAGAITFAALVLHWTMTRSRPAPTVAAAPHPLAPTRPERVESPPIPAAASTSPSAPAPRPAEQESANAAATERMIMAHASLRVPEIADPDSKSNREILGTMVAKALAEPMQPPPGAPTRH